jgi:phosphoribosylamine-glycine ligase
VKFLIVGEEFLWTTGAFVLQEHEGQDVRVYSEKPEGKEYFKGLIKQVSTLQEGLNWVGKSGYIISENQNDVSKLRRLGYKVYGGNKFTERLEADRMFGMDIARKYGVPVSDYFHFKSINETIAFIRKHPDQYVLKQEGNMPKSWNFTGRDQSGEDVIEQLMWMENQPEHDSKKEFSFMLQEFIDGVEFAVGAWWMYDDWKRKDDGSILMNVNKEHKKQGDKDTGLVCGEMGTVIRYTDNAKLFNETLNKMTPYFKQVMKDCCVSVDANCGLAEENGKAVPYLFEFTIREGYPACTLERYLLDIPTNQFLADLIDGKQGNVDANHNWGIVAVLGCGRFPVTMKSPEGSFMGQPVKIPQWDRGFYGHVFPGSLTHDGKNWVIAGVEEYVLEVCVDASSIEEANWQYNREIEQIIVRAPQFRHDIGLKFASEELPKLQRWGYV